MLHIAIVLCLLGHTAYGKTSKNHTNKADSAHENVIDRRLQINNILEILPKEAPLTILEGHPSPVKKIAWSSDNIHIATYAGDNLVRIWNTNTGALIKGIRSAVAIKDFSWALTDPKRIAITHHNNEVWICDLAQVFDLERAMESLSAEQLAFIALFTAPTPLTTLDEDQERMFKKLPDLLKESLTYQLDFNKTGRFKNPLR